MKLIAYRICWWVGNQDPIIDLKRSRLSEETFKAMGFKRYLFKEYDGLVHTNCEQVRTNSILSECPGSGNGIFDANNVRHLSFTDDMRVHCRIQPSILLLNYSSLVRTMLDIQYLDSTIPVTTSNCREKLLKHVRWVNKFIMHEWT